MVESLGGSDFQIGKTLNFDKLEISFSGGINNLFNELYFDNIRLNAFGKDFMNLLLEEMFILTSNRFDVF